MRIQDLESMKFEDLWDLHEELTKVLVEKIAAEKSELEKRLALLNRPKAHPEANRELGSNNPAPIERAKVAPKYRNTLPPYETWSGRGKLPRWLKKAIEAGSTIDDFKIV